MTIKCFHYSEAHCAGSRECARHQREETIVQLRTGNWKVASTREKQMLEKIDTYIEKLTRPYATRFSDKMDETDKGKVTQRLPERCLEQQLKAKLKSVRATNKTTFLVEIFSKKQSTAMQSVRNINGMPVEVCVNTALNINKGLLYICGHNRVNFVLFNARGRLDALFIHSFVYLLEQ